MPEPPTPSPSPHPALPRKRGRVKKGQAGGGSGWGLAGSASAGPDRLFVEPGVFEAPAVVIAIDHHRVALEIGLPAGRRHRIEDDRPGAVLGQLALDLPHQLLAL